ncbi:MAG: Gfo/Idh/MocA family oxidoreductase [Oscillospiraceae bacterium]|nr:Gfo/Idh/MocA family oxidoreductase [Oscillospiraceae bacterium]
MKKLNVAIIGQGRSGRGIHGAYFLKEAGQSMYNVVAVVDRDEQFRARALEEFPGCEVFAHPEELYGRTDIDLVVNASVSNEHYEVAMGLLEAGFNLVTEKPFARTRYECDAIIKKAKEKGVKLGVFQQAFLSEYYLKTKEVIDSGKLGEVQQIDITYSGFSRRWDWQSTQVKMGGNIYNTGPHPIGLAVGFLDGDPDIQVVFSRLNQSQVMSSGDSDAYAKILITAPGKPVVDVEVNSNDAFPSASFKVLGSKGTFQSSFSDWKLKYIVDGENPERPLVLGTLKDANGMPTYCSEQLITHEEEGVYEKRLVVATEMYYESVYKHITEGAELAVKPEWAAQIISIIETAHAQNPLPVKF